MSAAPLDAATLASLSPAAAKALAPGPGRMMAARGLVPLPRPAELAAVLYQIAAIDPALASAATATATGLPDKIVAAILADAAVPGPVLDWLVPRARQDRALLEALIGAAAVPDQTIVALAGDGDAALIDLIASNEQRLLRCPDIIGAMYGNPAARMSTVDRAVELAVRSGIRVAGISAWDELARLVTSGGGGGGPADDAVFAQALAGVAAVADESDASGGDDAIVVTEADDKPPPVDPVKVPIGKMTIPAKIRLATLGNAFARALLIRDPMKMVAVAAIKSPGVTDLEAAKYAGNQALASDVIAYIATRRDWTRLYGTKKALILNPKTPLTESAKLLVHLRERDVRLVAGSKGIPSAVVAQARKLLSARSGGK